MNILAVERRDEGPVQQLDARAGDAVGLLLDGLDVVGCSCTSSCFTRSADSSGAQDGECRLLVEKLEKRPSRGISRRT